MAKNDLVRYIVPVMFPDGARIIGGLTTPDRAISIAQIRQAVETNPDATFNPDDIRWGVTEEDIQNEIKKWHEANPDRVGARDLGLDTGNRLLTNPEIARELAAQQGAVAVTDLVPPPTESRPAKRGK